MRLAPRICGKAYRSPYSLRTVSLWPVRSPLMLDVYTSTWSQKNLGGRGGLGHPTGRPFHAPLAGVPKLLPQPMFFESPPPTESCAQNRRFFFRLFCLLKTVQMKKGNTQKEMARGWTPIYVQSFADDSLCFGVFPSSAKQQTPGELSPGVAPSA